MGPDAVIFLHRVEFIEAHHANRATDPLFSFAGDLRDAVCRVKLETPSQYDFAVSTGPATQFQNASSWRETLEKGAQRPACATGSAGRVNGRLISVEIKRRLIARGVIER